MDQSQSQPQEPQQVPTSSSAAIYTIGGVILICAGIGVFIFSQKPALRAAEDPAAGTVVRQAPATGQTPSSADPAPAADPAPSPKPAGTFKDGTYTAEGDYMTHAGPEWIKVTLTLKGGVVTDSDVQGDGGFGETRFMQGQFIDNYKPLVIGKDIADLQLGKVSGSSLTPIGFNDAVAKIEAQASSGS